MKPFLELVTNDKDHPSFKVFEVELCRKPSNWHYHRELELTYVLSGSGVRIVGDHLSQFKAGDLMITGENLPHDFNTQSEAEIAHFLVIQFKPELITHIPELTIVQSMLEKAKMGVLFKSIDENLINLLKTLGHQTTAEQCISLFNILYQLSRDVHVDLLCSKMFSSNRVGDLQLSRLNQVIDYVRLHYARSIDLKEMSQLTCMTEQSFCRWFKRTMDCSFVSYLNKYRVEQAGQLLANSDMQIAQIASECGFESLSSFNRAFKKYKGIPPNKYRQKWQVF